MLGKISHLYVFPKHLLIHVLIPKTRIKSQY